MTVDLSKSHHWSLPFWWAYQWQQAGIKLGDTIMLHSSISRTMKLAREAAKELEFDESNVTPQALLQSFLDAIGPEGTLIVPLFNFDFTQGVPFDIRSTPSHMGTLTEVVRKTPGVVRTGHPIYSFGVLGHEAECFRGLCNSSGYGSDSPFTTLMELDGKIAVLDLDDFSSMTFYHYVEEQERVGYRYHKRFVGKYTDEEGITTTRAFSIYVRDLERGVTTTLNPMGERLWRGGTYVGERPGEKHGLRSALAVDVYAATAAVIHAGQAEGTLYSIEPPHAA